MSLIFTGAERRRRRFIPKHDTYSPIVIRDRRARLAPARGILNGAALSTIIWLVVGFLVCRAIDWAVVAHYTGWRP